ncbi:MAG: DUF1592 domain-containing protein [Polyangiaceae bacterium]
MQKRIYREGKRDCIAKAAVPVGRSPKNGPRRPSRHGRCLAFLGNLWVLHAVVGCGTGDHTPGRIGDGGHAGGISIGDAAVGGAAPGLDPGRKDIHRLNSTEYNATVEDVLGTTLQPANGRWRGGELAGFDNIASVLGVDEAQYDRYFDAAQSLATEVVASEDLRARFVSCELSEPGCARSAIEAAGLRLFRRPLEPDEVATYQRVYDATRELGDTESAALTLTLQALLSSAEFLYRIELDPAPESTESHPLGAFELASRLSYFLWSSAPDDALQKAAADGSLAQQASLSLVVDRMLDDPKSERFVANFAGQWLGARQVPSHPASPKFYKWTSSVALSASQEMRLYFQDFLQSGRSWFEFPTADINYVDGQLSYFYGIPTTSNEFQRVEYHDDKRAGFFGLAGFLALSSFDRRTSPSRRGHWIAGNLLCAEPPPPPANVPKLDEGNEDAGAATLNVRQVLEVHRQNPGCAGCHALFDPYGLALEEYDPVGLYRSTYEDGTVVDASATLPPSDAYPEGQTFNGLEGLSHAVATDPRFGECLAQKLFTYGLGRPVTASDGPYLQRAQKEWLTAGQTPSIRRLIHALIASDAFRYRRGGG